MVVLTVVVKVKRLIVVRTVVVKVKRLMVVRMVVVKVKTYKCADTIRPTT
jgi:hypothetical protein